VSGLTAALRALALTLVKEFRLLRRDPVGLFMLIVAPIVVITACGFSLADVYSSGRLRQADRVIAVVDEDRGEVGRAVADALGHQPGLRTVATASPVSARELVLEGGTVLMAVFIPAGSTDALAQGRDVRLWLITDPVRYQPTVRVEVGLAEMCRRITAGAVAQAQARIAKRQAALRVQIDSAIAALRATHEQAETLAHEARKARAAAQAQAKRQFAATVASSSAQMRKMLEQSLDSALAGLTQQINAHTAREDHGQEQLRTYFAQLESAKANFEDWLARLKSLAGSHANGLPPPPEFPDPPASLAALLNSPPPAPVDVAALRSSLTATMDRAATPALAIPAIPEPPPIPGVPPMPQIPVVALEGTVVLPGSLGVGAIATTADGDAPLRGFNIFDFYVPGLAITFLLIGMLMGLSLALIDEHDWGTLARLRSAAAPLGTTLLGKLIGRFLIGFVQLVVLFAVGWAMFGVSLGLNPPALLVPCASVSFAAAGFGLVVAGVGRTRDAVLPVGLMVIMTMAAIGGCWWPIDFEPQLMRTVALGLPTTWAMHAFNDLMIRRLPGSAALVPSAVNVGFGILYAAVGVRIARRRFA
jgi:ABC-2 type transporter